MYPGRHSTGIVGRLVYLPWYREAYTQGRIPTYPPGYTSHTPGYPSSPTGYTSHTHGCILGMSPTGVYQACLPRVYLRVDHTYRCTSG